MLAMVSAFKLRLLFAAVSTGVVVAFDVDSTLQVRTPWREAAEKRDLEKLGLLRIPLCSFPSEAFFQLRRFEAPGGGPFSHPLLCLSPSEDCLYVAAEEVGEASESGLVGSTFLAGLVARERRWEFWAECGICG